VNPTIHRQGQGARLVIGRSRKNLVRYDTSAFAELQKPAVDPGPAVPSELPIRTFSDVTKGLGLSYEAERDLTRSLEEWMQAPDPVTFRGRVTKGLRGFAPDNYAVRNELWRRSATLYRAMAPRRPDRSPNSVVIQKSQRAELNRWKAGEYLKLNPSPSEEKERDFAREIGVSHDTLKALFAEVQKGEQMQGGRADGKTPDDFPPEALAQGTHHELEHTADRALAMEIAMDHLAEDPDYYTKLKQIEKSDSDDGWGPMPGIDGGLRRSVPGGYEYRFPPADLAPAPDPALERIMNAQARPQPPELLFCYTGDDEMYKGAGHKYIKRIPTGKPRPKYRYIYKLPQRKGLVVDEHLVSGSKFKVRHAGELGHFEVLEHDEKKGVVKVKHDESGRTAYVKKRDLARMLEAHHQKEGQEKAAAAPTKGAPEKLPRVTMADLARGEWEEPVGFEPTEAAALDHARRLKAGWDYAAIKQPSGFLVVAKRQRGGEKVARELHGAAVKVHLRNEAPMKAVYTLMEADDVVASHNPVNFNVRKDYPEGVQEREYHKSKHEQKKVLRIAAEMEPVFVINNNPDGVNGTPIITQDGIVLGGNARTMGIQRAYAKEPGSAKAYKNYLTAHAKDYGFNAADVRAMSKPILVRRSKVSKRHKRSQSDGEFDQTKYNAHLRLLGRRMNEGLTQGLDPRAEEVALGKNFVNDRMLRALTDQIEEGETLDKFLQSERSRMFIKTLWSNGILDDLNAGQFTYSDEAGGDEGLLNKEGRARLERVLVGKMIDSPTLLDRMSPTQRQALANSAVHVVVAQQNGWDVVPKLKRAIQIDQSIQKMEKELNAAGQPRRALKNFLRGKQQELPGVSKMVEEVRNDQMLQNLLVIVREKAGVKNMPRDFRGFALRAREDAKKNPELTGQDSLFGGAETPTRENPVDALDIEFGVTPPRAEEKRARAQAEKEEKARVEKERKRIAKERKQMAEGGLFAMAMDYNYDLVKAEAPNRVVERAINHAEQLVDAAVSTSMLEHGEVRVNGAKIAKRVMEDIAQAILKDPELARDQGRHPVDAKTVRGLVEAFCLMRGKDLLEKALGAGDLSKAQKRPPGTGWTPPSGKRRSWRKRVRGKYVYWTARKGHHVEAKQTLFGEEEQPLPKPTGADLKEAYNQVAESDEYRRADAIAARLKQHGLDKIPGKYAKAVEDWGKMRGYNLAMVRQISDIKEVHKRQDSARESAQRFGDLMREFELRQQTMFVEQPPEPEKLELEPAEVKEHARVAYGLGASKDPGQFSRYMSNLVDKHGEAQAKRVMDQVAYLQEARRGKATVRPPAKPKRALGGQQGLFSGHQATQRGEQGELFRSQRLVVKSHVAR
jgi:hypothetical protein